MAKKKNDEDPEDEKNDQFDDDEDFGLPDLEYEELDDEEGDEEPVEEDSADEEVSDDDGEEPVGDEAFEDDLDIGDVDDLDAGETEDWEKELEKELDDELKAGGVDDDDLFYEEESYDEFKDDAAASASTPKPEEEAPAEEPSVFSSDNVAEDEPFTQDEPSEPVKTTQTGGFGSSAGGGQRYVQTYETGNSGSKGKFARVVVIGTLLFAVVAVVFWLVKPNSDTPKKPVTEKKITPPPVVETAPDTVVEEKPVVQEPVKKEPARPEPNNVNPGEITVLEQRTGKSYIIIGSFFDGDQANDFSTKLAGQGKSPMIIPPFKDYRFYRVAIAEFDSFKDAEASVDSYKEEFGQEVWPLRY